jgi:hypothetical protein
MSPAILVFELSVVLLGLLSNSFSLSPYYSYSFQDLGGFQKPPRSALNCAIAISTNRPLHNAIAPKPNRANDRVAPTYNPYYPEREHSHFKQEQPRLK